MTETYANPARVSVASDRPLRPALRRGLMGKCPRCGEGNMFRAYLKVADACPVCGEELIHQRADDAPAYLTILLVGHFTIAGVLFEDELFPTMNMAMIGVSVVARRDRVLAAAAAAHKRRARRLSVGNAHARVRRPGKGIRAFGALIVDQR